MASIPDTIILKTELPAHAQHYNLGSVDHIALPPGWSLHDLECLLPVPTRKRGRAVFDNVESFCAYINLHKRPGTLLLADLPPVLDTKRDTVATAEAWLDHHEPDPADVANVSASPGWGEHRAGLLLRPSAAWREWFTQHRAEVSQIEFAEFLEEHTADVSEPEGAAVLEAARDLRIARSVKFESGASLRDGTVQLEYRESDAQKGSLAFPERMTLWIPVLHLAAAVPVLVRLRYRLREGRLSFVLVLDRPEEVVAAAVRAELLRVTQITALPVLMGRVLSVGAAQG